MKDDDVSRCGNPVPLSLCGALKASPCRLATRRDGWHDGDHKSHLTIKGVGRITWRWKNRTAQQPPVIVLPPPTI